MKAIKYFTVALAVLLLTGVSSYAQEKPDSTSTGHKMMKHDHQMMHGMMKDSSMHQNMRGMKMMKDSSMHHNMQNMKMMKDSSMYHNMQNMKMTKDSAHQMMTEKKEKMNADESPLIREGEIDLKAIDENKNGKVYQDVMDWNVISDKAGECPLCGMKLKEVTIEQAKANLLKNNFKVK